MVAKIFYPLIVFEFVVRETGRVMRFNLCRHKDITISHRLSNYLLDLITITPWVEQRYIITPNEVSLFLLLWLL